MKKNIRINTTVSPKINAWLDEQSAETGLTKSAIVLFLLKITKTKKKRKRR